MIARRLVSAVVALLCVLAGGLVLVGASASAAGTYKFSSSFGSAGSAAGQLSAPKGVAVNATTGDVYVADTGNDRVDEFSASGTFIRAWGWGVADGLSSFETCTLTCQAGLSGAEPGEFTATAFVAVDNSGGASAGDVYVGDTGDNIVTKFTASGVLVSSWGTGGQLNGSTTGQGTFAPLGGVAVEAGGSLLVERVTNKKLFKFTQEGVFGPGSEFESFFATSARGIAIDSEEHIFVVTNTFRVPELTNTGAAIGRVNTTASTHGLAVNKANELFVDTGTIIERFAFAGAKTVSEPGNTTCVFTNTAGCPATESFGVGHLAAGSGVGVGVNGDIYVAEDSENKIEIFTPPVTPEPLITSALDVRPSEATLDGTVNPKGAGVTACQFEYGTVESNTFAETVACDQSPASIGSGTSPVPVTATIKGLTPNTAYQFRLTAANAEEEVHSAPIVVTTPGPAGVDSATATGVTASGATLLAQVNPHSLDTVYRFEYGTSTSYGASIPVPDADIGPGSSDVSASQAVNGLSENTLYHFRVVATNSAGTTDGPDRVFFTGTGPSGCPNTASRQGASAALPDCRAFEQVTPVDKGIAEDMFGDHEGTNRSVGYSSEDGDHYLLTTAASLGTDGVSGSNRYVFSRTGEGWRMRSLAVEGVSVQSLDAFNYLFDPVDFSMVGTRSILGSSIAGVHEFAFVGPFGGPYVRSHENFELAGGSNDLSHVVFESKELGLAPGDEGQVAGRALYEMVGGVLRLVNVEGGSPVPVGSCGAVLGQEARESGGTHNAVSGDGSKVFFTSPDPKASGPGCGTPPQLYMRVDGTSTVNVSAPAAGAGEPSFAGAAVFVGASTDGSKVFFLSRGELTGDDTGHAVELYEYNTITKVLTRVSRGDAGSAEGHVDFVGAVSSDGSAVYFTAHGELAASVPALGAKQVYLYRYDTVSEETTFIAKIGQEDYPLRQIERIGVWPETVFPKAERGAKEVGSDDEANWYTTGDGRYLVFGTNQDVTGYDSTPASGARCNPLTTNAIRCVELYRYSAVDNSLVCVSCGLPGERPVDNALFARSAPPSPAGESLRPISENGEYVFFDTASALVPQASSGEIHVYEWHDGTVSLLSAPHDPASSFFVGSSPSGRDVFIGTHSQLVPGDTDVAGDLYDARVDGGFTGVTPPICTGTGCQGVPAAPPIFATPSSVTFEGVGNFPSPVSRVVKKRTKALTSAQKLKAALKACRHDRAKRKRAVCETRARARYARALRSIRANRGGK